MTQISDMVRNDKEHTMNIFNKDHFVKRCLMSAIGVLICGIAVGFFKHAFFGVDPFQSLMAGLDALIPIKFGTLYVIVNIILLLFSLVFDRHYIGPATFINLFLLGYVAQFSLETLQHFFPVPALYLRAIFLLIGIGVICFASSFYITADLGVSTYDAVALIISNTWHIWQFKFIRIITDVICVVAGVGLFLLATKKIDGIQAVVGIGTIITAFFMGPLVDFFQVKVARPILEGKSENK